MGNGIQPPLTVEDPTLAIIRDVKQQQISFFRTMKRAVELAGEQVQDKRIEWLENPPDVSTSDFLVDLLISLALTPAAGLVINGGMKLIGSVLKTRGALGKKNHAWALKPWASNAAKNTEKIARSMDKELLIKETELWKEFVEDISDVGKEVPADFAKKRRGELPKIKEGLGNDFNTAGFSANVAVQSAVKRFADNQELAINRLFEAYETMIQEHNIHVRIREEIFQFFKDLKNKYQPGYDEPTIDQLDLRIALFFEACIWVMHFGDALKQLTTTWNNPIDGKKFTVIKMELYRPVEYWVKHFPDPKSKTGGSFLESSMVKNNPSLPKNVHRTRVNAAFGSITGAFPREQVDAALELEQWFTSIRKNVEELNLLFDPNEKAFMLLGPIKLK